MDTGYQLTSVPQERLQRSRFEFHQDHKTTFNAGMLVPFFVQPVIAGSTVSVDVSSIIRTSSPFVVPVLDNLAVNFWFFFCPNRLVYDEWKLFMGEDPDYYTKAPRSTYLVPTTSMPSSGWSAGSVADHFGLPTGVTVTNIASHPSRQFNALPFRAYGHIYNEFFRDENSMPKCIVNTSSSNDTGANTGGNFLNTASKGGDLAPLSRPHDLFGACLPFLQKGDPSTVGSRFILPEFDVVTSGASHTSSNDLKWGYLGSIVPNGVRNVLASFISGSQMTYADSTVQPSSPARIYPSNLVTDTANYVFNANLYVSDLRTSIAMQHLLEARGRAGSRYRETLNSIYGVEDTNPNLDVATYLGGKRVPINLSPVTQQNNPNDSTTTQLGTQAAYSVTGDYDNAFTYSALEHGLIIGLLGVRTEKTYQQGVDRLWRMREITDYWNPYYAGLSDSPVRSDEIYFEDSINNNLTFGYQTSFYWEHNRPNLVSGMFRSNHPTSLDYWHFADNYASRPTLGQTWLKDNSKDLVDRTLSVTSAVADQFIADIDTHITMVDIMPADAIPGIHRV